MKLRRMLLVFSTAMLLAACGPQNPEEKLQDAAERVQEAKSDVISASDDVTSARDDVESHRKAVRDAELGLASARKELRRAQKRLATSREQLDSSATDTGIFRLIQSVLLSDPELQNTAVYVSVIDGSVFLYGEVVAEQQKIRAEEIARTTPGVSQIRSFIEIEGDNGQDP